MAEPTVSVLLPVHAAIRPSHLGQALRSLVGQTRRADEVVVVEDGPLSEPHHAELRAFAGEHPGVVPVRLGENGGAGVANQAGLEAARGDWIAKADADDVNLPHRIERQLAAVREGGVDVCGAAMGEFRDDPDVVLGVRRNPTSAAGIARRMRWNNPVNHPTAFFRRTTVLDAGGYRPMRYMQDYDLFARLLARGAVLHNLPDVLVLFRADAQVLGRRRSRAMHAWEWELQQHLRAYGLTSRAQMVRNLAMRTGARVLPVALVEPAYHAVFRSDRSTGTP